MDILSNGTQVRVGDGIWGYITAACIRNNNISYEVTYFHDGEYITVWLYEFQFSIASETNKQKIGFK
jgi:hypothetical protein